MAFHREHRRRTGLRVIRVGRGIVEMAENDQIDSAIAGLSPERKRPLPSSARGQGQQDDGAGSLRLQRRGALLEAGVRRLARREETYRYIAGLHDEGIARARNAPLARVEKSDAVRVV